VEKEGWEEEGSISHKTNQVYSCDVVTPAINILHILVNRSTTEAWSLSAQNKCASYTCDSGTMEGNQLWKDQDQGKSPLLKQVS